MLFLSYDEDQNLYNLTPFPFGEGLGMGLLCLQE